VRGEEEGKSGRGSGMGGKREAGVAILISNKIDFQLKVIKKDKEGHFIFIKGKIHQDDSQS